jgi:membrane protease YdiL (CAAX protease family)
MQNGLELYAPRESTHRRTWTLAAIILIVAFFALGGVVTALFFGPLGLKNVLVKDSWQRMSVEMLLTFGVGALFCLLWIRFFERRSVATIGFSAGGLRLYGRGLLIGFAFITAIVCIIYAMGGYVVEGMGIWSQMSGGALLALLGLFLAFMIQGGTEELFMRGWLFQLITSRYGVVFGIVGNMLVFSLLHAGNIKPSLELYIGLFNIVLVAIFLSLYARKEGSLWGVCAWHSAWNWLLGVGFGLEVSGQALKVVPLVIDLKNAPDTPIWLNGGVFGPEASVITSVVLLVGMIYVGSRKGHGRVYGVPVIETPTPVAAVSEIAP